MEMLRSRWFYGGIDRGSVSLIYRYLIVELDTNAYERIERDIMCGDGVSFT